MRSDSSTRITVVVTWIIVALWLFAGAVYCLYGHDVIDAAYEGRSLGILNDVIVGQSVHSVEHYQALADAAMTDILLSIGIFALLVVCVTNGSKAALAVVALLPVFYYARMMATSLVGGDGDEFLIQAFRYGVAHPCGYPVYLWIGKAFLVLGGNHLGTMNLVSLVFSLGTLLLVWRIARQLGCSSRATILGILVYAFSPVFWVHAVTAEVYNVNAFFLAAMILILVNWDNRRPALVVVACGLLYGLSLGVHFANVLLLPALVAFILIRNNDGWSAGIRSLVIFAIGGAAGAIVPFAYIFLRSGVLPATGAMYNPDTVRGFLHFVSGRQYDVLAFHSVAFMMRRIIQHAGFVMLAFGGVGVVVAGVGMLRRDLCRSLRSFILLGLCAEFLFFSFYRVGDFYMMPTFTYLGLALCLCFGLESLSRRKESVSAIIVPVIALSVALQIAVFPGVFDEFVERRDSRQAGQRMLERLPVGAVLFAPWHRYTSLLCLQQIEGIRPDVTLYEGSLQPRHYKEAGVIETIDWHAYLAENVDKRPVYCSRVDAAINATYEVEQVDTCLYFIGKKQAVR